MFILLYCTVHHIWFSVELVSFRNIEISPNIFIKGHKKGLGRWGIHLSVKNRIFGLCNRRSVVEPHNRSTQETVEAVLIGNDYWEHQCMFICQKPEFSHSDAFFSLCSTTAARRMGLTAAPSPSNTLPATPAVSQAWTDPSPPRCPCRHRCRPNPTNPPKPPGGAAATVPPARPTTRPFTSALQMKCATVASASPTCPRTMTTRRCRCRCPRSEAPCWGRRSEVGLLTSTPTRAPSAPKCDRPLPPPL